MRKLITVLSLMLVLCLALCACGGSENNAASKDDTASAEASVEESVASSEDVSSEEDSGAVSAEDSKTTYSVTVTDADGKAMAGVMVQLCLDTCCPGVTDANGVATFKLDAADYKVSVMTMPEGYTYAGEETEFHFEEGSTSLTISLKVAE